MSITTLVIVSDMHINSTVGLCNPTVNLDDGGTYHASVSQRWLWECWLDFCQRASEQPGRKIAILNGDLGELDTKRRSYQLVTPNKATIIDMVLEALEPLIQIVDSVYIIRGTAAHTGKSAWLEEAIGKDLETAVKNGEQGSWYHLRGIVEGVRIDVAHHASMGSLPWTEKHAALRVAERAMWRYAIDMKQPVPHLVIRSHNHRYAESGDNYSTKGILTPAFQLVTEYAYRAGQENSISDIGGIFIRCENGNFTGKPILYKPKGATKVWTRKL